MGTRVIIITVGEWFDRKTPGMQTLIATTVALFVLISIVIIAKPARTRTNVPKYTAGGTYSSRLDRPTNKNFKGRDQVYNNLRDGINKSNLSWGDKVRMKNKLHDDMY